MQLRWTSDSVSDDYKKCIMHAQMEAMHNILRTYEGCTQARGATQGNAVRTSTFCHKQHRMSVTYRLQRSPMLLVEVQGTRNPWWGRCCSVKPQGTWSELSSDPGVVRCSQNSTNDPAHSISRSVPSREHTAVGGRGPVEYRSPQDANIAIRLT